MTSKGNCENFSQEVDVVCFSLVCFLIVYLFGKGAVKKKNEMASNHV